MFELTRFIVEIIAQITVYFSVWYFVEEEKFLPFMITWIIGWTIYRFAVTL